MINFIRHHLKRFTYAFEGIFFALKTDRSYRSQVYGIGSLVAVVLFVLKPLSETEIIFIILSYILMLITELQNSSFEAALDRLHPEHHDDIGHSKDMAAGAVLTAMFFMIFVLITVAVH